MKAKLVFSTETLDMEQWAELPFIPRINEWINVPDILKEEEIKRIKTSSLCWSGIRGRIQTVEYRHNDSEYYAEIYIWCED
ncbi:MAG TPA: hypothetical protein VIH57_11610 [Bacteroidales bacterium]